MQKIKFQRGSIVSPSYLNETQKSIRFTEESRENYFSDPTDLEESSWEVGSRDGIKDWEIDRNSNIGRLAYSGRVLGTDPNSVAILYGPPSTTKFNAIRGENEEFLGLDSTSQLPLGSFGLIIEAGSMVSPTGDAWTWGREYLITNGGVTRFGIFHGTDQELKLVEELPSRAIPFSLLFKITISVSGEITELIDLRPHTHIDNLYTYTQGLVSTSIISTDYIASSWERLIIDTRDGPITVTLPSKENSTDSDQITVVDAFNTFNTYPLIIRPNPEDGTLNNSTEDYFVTVSGSVIDLFFYDNPDEGLSTWKLKDSFTDNLTFLKFLESLSPEFNFTSGVVSINEISADKIISGSNNNIFTSEDSTKLDGIEEGAQVNVSSDWNIENSSDPRFILNKPDLSSYLTSSSTLNADRLVSGITNKVFTGTQRSKLDGIEEGAQVNVLSDWNAQNDTEPGFIYNKPDLSSYLTSSSSIDADNLIDGATNKIFSAADKSKLDGIEENAQINVSSDWNAQTNIDPGFIYNKPDLSVFFTDASEISADQLVDGSINKVFTLTNQLKLTELENRLENLEGISYLSSARVATTEDLLVSYDLISGTLTNNSTQVALEIDSVTLLVGERVLVKDQTISSQNGIYIVTDVGSDVTNWVLTRASDFNEDTELLRGSLVYVEEGITQAGSSFVLTSDSVVIANEDPIQWAFYSKVEVISAGTGLSRVGNTISLEDTAVSPNTYGTSTSISSFIVDAQGRLTFAEDLAIRSASTTESGIVQLSDAVDSTSTTEAATANSVKVTYDLASAKVDSSAISSFALTYLDDVDAATTLTTLGISSFAQTLLDDIDSAAALTTLNAAPIDSATLTGTPTAPTAPVNTNTTQLATTAFVQTQIAAPFTRSITAVVNLDIDCSLGNYFTKSISAASIFTFSNAPADVAYAFTLEVGHISGTITWPTSVVWPSGIAPALTTGKTHLFVFVTDDGGTRWRGTSLVNYNN